MLRRSFTLLALLLVMVPMTAFAGTVSSRVATTGGSISINGGAPQTSATGTVSKTYTTDAVVAITPSTGYAIAAVTMNGTAKPLTSPLTVPLSSTSQTVSVSFARQMVSVSATATSSDGTVSPYGTSNLYVNNAVTYSFYPNTGKRVESITGLPAGTVLKDSAGNVQSLPFAGSIKAYFTVPSTPVSMVASFVSLTASAGASQTTLLSNGAASANLSGSASASGASFAWTQASGPAQATIANAATANPTVSFTTAGIYSFKLTATSGSATATSNVSVTVTTSPTVAAQNQCVNCHNGAGVGAGTYDKWAASTHATKPVMCATCHVGADTTAHPGTAATVAVCENCHTATLSQTTHPTDLTAAKCLGCHDSHNPAQGIAALDKSAHPAVTLYTFEEIGMQMAGGQKVPVQVDANGKGLPYSPKQTCGTSGCHVKNGVDYTYDKITDHAFHSAQGRNEYVDSADGKLDATKNKPWYQSTAMVGKW